MLVEDYELHVWFSESWRDRIKNPIDDIDMRHTNKSRIYALDLTLQTDEELYSRDSGRSEHEK